MLLCSSEDDEDDYYEAEDSDESDFGGRGRSKRNRREPLRRSSRARLTRFDKEFSKCSILISFSFTVIGLVSYSFSY